MRGFDCAANCPLVPTGRPALDWPVGQVHRVAAGEEEVDETKRNVLKLVAVAALVGAGGGGLVGGTLQYVQPPVVGISAYPRTQLVDVNGTPLTVDAVESEYNVGTADLFLFNYPLQNEPNFLLNLYPANGQAPSASNPGAQNVPGGVGTHGSIVAYSGICQHLGCPAPAISYYPPGTCPKTFGSLSFYIHCSCHGSTYDVTNSASNLTGPAVLPLPQVVLDVDSDGVIYAIGENGPPVNGHLNTLQGDYGVGTSSQLTRESPVILCSFPS
ncbi:MAG TPA: Rieske 2Fe-2S domain-containing protein [Thermoplasmata archaeon]|jgi:Rieske Fe-S protein|nr:Rieske 2Fe-2S domain-containing protein [Thermoplasmata archaeon]